MILSLQGIYLIHTCLDIETLFILLPNPCLSCIRRMKPVTLLSYVNFDWKTRLSWFKVLLVSFQYYHLPEMSRWCAKISPNLRAVPGKAWRWRMVFVVCSCWLAGTGVATAIRIVHRPISFLIRHCASRLEWLFPKKIPSNATTALATLHVKTCLV